jgi:hypothetical protein
VGDVIDITGTVTSGGIKATVSVSVDWFPAASFAVMVNALSPSDSWMLEIDQDAVPLAIPLPPFELTQVT